MFPGPLGSSLAGKALAQGRWSLRVRDIRDFADGKHRQVDDTPAGGGPGMVLRADVLARAIDAEAAEGLRAVRSCSCRREAPIRPGEGAGARRGSRVVLVCGRFEGVDERLFARRPVAELSLGDFVLSGGEIAALAVLDACVRLLPGVMGHAESHADESFETGLLEYPQYTRPQSFEGLEIPDVLTSGHHAAIAAWRRAAAEDLTRTAGPICGRAYAAKLESLGQATTN